MRAWIRSLLLSILLAIAAFGQQSPASHEQPLRLQYADSEQTVREFASLIASVGDLRPFSIDAPHAILNLKGTADQIDLAEWLARVLDQPVTTPLSGRTSPGEYRLPNAAEPVVHVYFPRQATTPQAITELATMLRTLGDIRRVFVLNAQHAIVLRGTPEQAALADWLVRAADQPPAAAQLPPASYEYKVPNDREPSVRVFYLHHAATMDDITVLSTGMRTIGDIRRIFLLNAPRIIAVRGTPEQAALAEWMASELDAPVQPPPLPAVSHEFRLTTMPDPVVRVYHLQHAATPQQLIQTSTQVRSTTGARRIYPLPAQSSIVVRGTLDQLTAADRIVLQADRQPE